MKNLSRSLIITIALGGAAVLYVFLVFLPCQRSIGQLRSDIEQKRRFAGNQAAWETTLDTVREQLAKAEAHHGNWSQNAPRTDTASEVNAKIGQAMRHANVDLIRFSPTPPESLASIGRIPINLECRGRYEQVFQLVYELERLNYTVWIDFAQITPDRGDEGILRCELNLLVFADLPNNSD